MVALNETDSVKNAAVGAASPQGSVAVEVNDVVAVQNLASQALHRGRAKHLQEGRCLHPSQAILQGPLVGQVGQVRQVQSDAYKN